MRRCLPPRREGPFGRRYDEKTRVVASLESSKEVHGDALLYTVGRKTNADLLNLEAVGLSADDRGRIT